MISIFLFVKLRFLYFLTDIVTKEIVFGYLKNQQILFCFCVSIFL